VASFRVMEFDAAVALVRSWLGQPVVVVLEPDHSVMPGVLHELDSSGMDGVLFAVADPDLPHAKPTGVAVALFRDAFAAARVEADGALRLAQGRIEIIVRPGHATEAPRPAH
jgi:hypothetical protein